jgi:hypothetical protein
MSGARSASLQDQRHANASAVISLPSGWGLLTGAISPPSGATMRFLPPRRWKRIGMRTISVLPSSRVVTLGSSSNY